MDIRQQLLAAFEGEHREHLDAIRAALAAKAEGRPADWNDVFRRAHSLKGAARAVDLPPVEGVAHRLESLFERLADGRGQLDADALAATHLALDRIEAFVADLRSGDASMPDDAQAALDRCLGVEPEAPPTPAEPRSAAPPPEPAAIVPQAIPGPVSTAGEPTAEPERVMLRVPAEAVAALSGAAHGLAGLVPSEAAVAEGLTRIVAATAELRRRVGASRNGDARGDGSLGTIETGLTALARMAADLSRVQKSYAADVEAAASRIREEAERLALVPAETVFGGFARAIREMARSEGREVKVAVRGLDLPVDRATLQILKDPVLHALRNALRHGGEPAVARARAGKPPTPEIVFEIRARGGRLEIGIHDDGPGPDLVTIEARARQQGFIAPGEIVDAERILGVVFEDGLTTTAEVDTVSGRGIGLAVVAEAARRLSGSVRLQPRAPYGASLVMNLPLAASQRPILVVEAAGTVYALPSAAVERLLRLDRDALGSVAGRPVARVGEGNDAATLPVADLAQLLGLAETAKEAHVAALVLRSGNRRCVLAVDRLRDVRTLLVLPAPPIAARADLVSGTVILGNETPVLVLDPDGLVARTLDASAHSATVRLKTYEAGDGTKRPERRSTILVVDDSITTRTLEKSILEAAGYRVVVCVDGQDALDRLRARIEPIDLVVADIEMPRLDGFGLVKALKAEPTFAELPVILMTSRGDAADVARGLELGADAYLTKQKFDQRELLDTVGQLL